MAPTYITGIVLLLSQLLPMLGVTIGSAELTTTIQTVIAIVTGLVVAYRQIVTGRSTFLGTRP